MQQPNPETVMPNDILSIGELSRALLSNLPGGAAFVVGSDLRYLLAEGEALAVAGFTREDFVGRTIFEVLPPSLATNYEPMYRKALAGEPCEHEHHAHNHWYISRLIPLRAENGEIYAVLAVSYDITDRKRAEDERKQVESVLRESEAFRRLAVESGRMGTWRWDCRSRQCWGDAGFLSLWGVPPSDEKLPVSVFTSRLSPEGAAALEAVMRKDIAPGEEFDGQLEVVAGSNAGRWIRWRGQAEREKPWIISGVSFDVTEQKRAEVALRESEACLQSIANLVPDLLWDSEPDGSTNWYNQRWMEYTGQTFEQAISWGWTDAIHPDEQEGSARRYREAVEQGMPLLQEHRIRRHDGAYRWFVVKASPLKDESGKVIKMYGAATDIHEQRVALEALRESEEKFRTLANTAPALIWFNDAQGNNLFSNQHFLDFTGRSAEQIRGEGWQELVHPDDAENYIADYLAAVREQRSWHNRNRIRRYDGVWRWHDNYAQPLFGADGVYLGHVGVTIDNTDAIEAETALRQSEEKYRSLFESINDGFALLEVLYDDDNRPIDCRFLEVSPSFEAQTRLPQAQGKTLRELIPSIEPSWFEYYHQALVTNALVHFEGWQDYLKTWFEVDVLPYGNPQDRQVIIVFRDINERKQAQANQIQLIREQSAREQERQRAETLAELDRAKTLFFTHISHEFRTPLTLSLAPLQDALSDRTATLAPVHRERLSLVHRNSLRLLKLVNTLLDFSRIEAGRMEAVYKPTDLATYTAELASVFRSAIERAGLQLIVDCPTLPEPVFVDREMWEKIVLNLLSNAFKFTFEGEIRVSLHSTDSNQAILQIQDTGTGIAPEHLPHLFERFYQVRGTQARTHDGSGIGLALVHELVRLQGGTIEVSSTLGEGTCFTIALTFGIDHLPSVRVASPQENRFQDEGDRQPTRTLASTAMSAAAYVEEAERWLPQEAGEQGSRGAGEQGSRWEVQSSVLSSAPLPLRPSAHILIVDDNADIREYLTRILSQHVQVEAVADGATALEVAQERVPDLILSDIMMPGLDGFELLGALRADPRTREVPIILLSARAGVEAIVEGLEAGADDYLIKPFWAQELVSRVTAHLQMAQLRGEALQEARSTIRSRDEFISIVSHELNTPLVSIVGWTRLLRANSPSPTMLTKALDTIERNAILQAKLVQDLLDISHIAAGKLRLNTEPVELEAVIETAMATVTQMAQTKGIDLNWHKKNMARQDAHTANSIVVMGDRDRLGQVICNLLSNAIKFTPSSGSVTIELSVIDDDHSPNISCAQICVTDTGIGIAADFLPHVFERFRQARDSDAAKGMGLGLAIARHLVELHNGTISAQSAGVGQGASFTVKLPFWDGFVAL